MDLTTPPPLSMRVPTYGSGGGVELTYICSLLSHTTRALHATHMGSSLSHCSFQVSHCRLRLVPFFDPVVTSTTSLMGLDNYVLIYAHIQSFLILYLSLTSCGTHSLCVGCNLGSYSCYVPRVWLHLPFVSCALSRLCFVKRFTATYSGKPPHAT